MAPKLKPSALMSLVSVLKDTVEDAARLDEASLHNDAVAGRNAILLADLRKQIGRAVQLLDEQPAIPASVDVEGFQKPPLASLIDAIGETTGRIVPFGHRGVNFRPVSGDR